MENSHSQNSLYQKRNFIKQNIRPLSLTSLQKDYIRDYVKKHKKILYTIFFLLCGVLLLEIFIPLFTHIFIQRYANFLEHTKLFISIGVFSSILIVYLVFSYFQIYKEKSFVVHLLNDLRENWFAKVLYKSPFSITNEDKGRVLTKISYHFGLLQIGLQSSLFPLVQFVILQAGVFVVASIISSKLFIICLVFLPINILIGIIAYVIGKYYVSKDQTLYSKILMFVSKSVDEIFRIQFNNTTKDTISYFNDLVSVDTYFRIHRELWIKFGQKILFTSIAFCAAIMYVLEIYFPFLEVEHNGQYIVYILLFGLLVKLLYQSLRIGLFLFPLKLGLILCIPETKRPKDRKKRFSFKTIVFKTSKAKISTNKYIKKTEFSFSKGERILITGDENSGKTTLSYVFAGLTMNDRSKPWIIKVDKRRIFYDLWKRTSRTSYLVSPEFQTKSTIIDTLTEESLQNMSSEKITNIIKKLNKYKELDFLFDSSRSLAKNINTKYMSFVQKALLQMAHCIISPPQILIVDNAWLDINNSQINGMIKHLNKTLPNTIIICFSTKLNNIINYDKTFTI